jgi:8-oxo-dGTP pyrophosphatase MutT (NUDIX family)
VKVFISWSGETSKRVALALKELIQLCLAPVEAFVSSEDLALGSTWQPLLEKELSASDVGILCLTADSIQSPWVLFEAGAMLRAKLLIPYLVDLGTADLPPPLRAYHAGSGDEATAKMLFSISEAAGLAIGGSVMKQRFDAFWPPIKARISGRAERPELSGQLGLVTVFRSRAEGLEALAPLLENEIQTTKKRLWLVGSSLQGFDVGAASGRSNVVTAVAAAAGIAGLDVRILLTDPSHCGHREAPEKKNPGRIAAEIEDGISKLLMEGVPPDRVRLYPGTPTVSAVATDDYMLLNPYPYAQPAHQCFSMLVRKMSEGGIYQQYCQSHFEQGWELGIPLARAAQEDIVVGTDWQDKNPHALALRAAHASGRPHRAVHIEAWRGDRLLVWRRRDDRWELPGGHPRWQNDRAEEPRSAAARELLEELGLDGTSVAQHAPKLARSLRQRGRWFKPGQNGRDNEWVYVYRVDVGKALKIPWPPHDSEEPTSNPLSEEGNKSPRWVNLRELLKLANAHPLLLASSLKLFIGRTVLK